MEKIENQGVPFHPSPVMLKTEKSSDAWLPALRGFVVSRGFRHFSLANLLFNILAFCLPYNGQTVEYAQATEKAQVVITIIFAVEVLLSFLGRGRRAFWSSVWYRFDTCLVIASLPDLFLSSFMVYEAALTQEADTDSSSFVYFRVLRALRILRAFRMFRAMRFWRPLKRVVLSLLMVGQPFVNAVFFLIFLIIAFALIAMQMFGGHCGSEVCPLLDVASLSCRRS